MASPSSLPGGIHLAKVFGANWQAQTIPSILREVRRDGRGLRGIHSGPRDCIPIAVVQPAVDTKRWLLVEEVLTTVGHMVGLVQLLVPHDYECSATGGKKKGNEENKKKILKP